MLRCAVIKPLTMKEENMNYQAKNTIITEKIKQTCAEKRIIYKELLYLFDFKFLKNCNDIEKIIDALINNNAIEQYPPNSPEKKGYFRQKSNGLPTLIEIEKGTLFYFNNIKIEKELCIKQAEKGERDFIGTGYQLASSKFPVGSPYDWYLTSAKVIPVENKTG